MTRNAGGQTVLTYDDDTTEMQRRYAKDEAWIKRKSRTRAGKHRLLTLDGMDKRTVGYRLAQERIQKILDEEYNGQPTARQYMAVEYEVLLSLMIESSYVQHASGQPINQRRLVEMVNAQRGERKSRR